jgi:MoaA/NifB/PqqE/SkfB family radical SAM enzyme
MARIRRALDRGDPPAAPARRSIPVVAERLAPTSAGPDDRWSACYAPHASMYFDQFGKVRACCQAKGVTMGDVTRQTLREVWESAESEAMRTALEHDDYSAGCEFCEWQVREGNDAIVFARGFDDLRPAEHRPRWPRMMEFAVTNTCNLQCVMCDGSFSSTIRAKRERRPPLPALYGEAWFEQLAEFLPHLEEARFLGGEPFLGAEPLRIMEMLAELPHPPRVTITTNATIYTERVRRVIEALSPNVVISIDGASIETYDAIRVGAHFPDVVANIDRFRSDLGPGKVSLTHCLMTGNWHEFADLLALAEERDLHVGVNIVRFPAVHSLYQLPADELAHVVERLHATEVDLTGTRRASWDDQLAALAHRLRVLQADDPALGPHHGLPGTSPTATAAGPGGPTSRWPWLPFPEQATAAGTTEVPGSDAPEAHLAVGTSGLISVLRLDPGVPVDLDGLDGLVVEELYERLVAVNGGDPPTAAPRSRPADDDRFWLWLATAAGPPVAEVVGTARRDDDGQLTGIVYVVRAPTRPTGEPWPDRAPAHR